MYKRQTYNNAKACKIKYLSIYLNKYWILKCFDTISSGIYIHRISIKLNIKVVDQPNEGRSNPRKVCFLPTCITGLVSGFDEINCTNVSIVGTPLTITENRWQNIIKPGLHLYLHVYSILCSIIVARSFPVCMFHWKDRSRITKHPVVSIVFRKHYKNQSMSRPATWMVQWQARIHNPNY